MPKETLFTNINGKQYYNIIPGIGVGDIKLGADFYDFIKLYPKYDEIDEYQNHKYENEYYYFYYKKGLCVFFIDDVLDRIFLYSGIKGGYEEGRFSKFNGILKPNISLSSKFEEVKSVFGKPKGSGGLSLVDIPSKWIAYTGISFFFVRDTDEMIYMNIRPIKLKELITDLEILQTQIKNEGLSDSELSRIEDRVEEINKKIKALE